MTDPITGDPITPEMLAADLAKIRRHIELAPDEQTEIAYREVYRKWMAKFSKVVKVTTNPPSVQRPGLWHSGS